MTDASKIDQLLEDLDRDMDFNEKIERDLEVLDLWRQDPDFEALFQGFVHTCHYREPVETLASEFISGFTVKYTVMASFLYEALCSRTSLRQDIRRFMEEGVPLKREDVLLLRERGILGSNGDLNPWLVPYLEQWHDFLDALKTINFDEV
jgi:hypothetical protein